MYYQNNKLEAIHLLLGNACNKHCPYCLQDERGLVKKQDFDIFEQNIRTLVNDRNLTTDTVHYWGGEPLLYRNTLYKTITLFDELFPAATLHRVTTNGTLVDEEYVEFCNSNPKIHTVVSLHEFEIPEKNIKQIGRIKSLNLTGVINKHAPSPMSYYDRWRRICDIAGRDLHVGLYPIHTTDGSREDTWLDLDDVEGFFKELLFDVAMNKDSYYKQSILENLVFTKRKSAHFRNAPKCFNEDILSIDMFGNQYVCHHNNALDKRVFNVFEKRKYIPIVEQKFDQYYSSKECQDCEYLSVCHGGCYLTNTHDVECYWFKLQNKFLEWYEIFNH